MNDRYRPDDLLTRQQAAKVVGISLSRLAQLRRAGKIDYRVRNPHTGAVRYRYSDCEKLKREREQLIENAGVPTASVMQWTP